MNIIETTFEKLPTKCLLIGFEGENQRATVRIDCASVFAEYPNATPALIVKPLFADAYPVVVDRNGTDVDWLITSEILSFTGDGEIQLVFYKDEVICKSAITKIRVCRSLHVTGDMPDPVAQWIDDANAKLHEVDAQIVELEGMVDTATDAATRAEQSASTASTKAEQAAGSAATATAKATEATNAAGTATAKAAEAQTAAQTATAKATAAAESERIATAKAVEATTAATTATTKAEQATEAAQTATEKAGDASASATAAHASEINAAESADDALSAEVGANAAKRAAEASATQASISERNAGIAAQTATQKAAEATQSATNAATFAGTATTKAEEAAASAQAASDAQTAVEQTAEQLADSLEQIEQNTQDIAELDERKANIDGYYPDMTVGNAEQLNSSKYVENSEPYTLRPSGGTSDIGNREYLDAVVGVSLPWNQMVRDEASPNETDFAPIVTVDDAVEDAAGVKVKIEPVQDLHGYDHPWPAGGGNNLWGGSKLAEDISNASTTVVWDKTAKTIKISTNANPSGISDENLVFTNGIVFEENTVYTLITDGTAARYLNMMFKYTDGTTDRSLGIGMTIGAFSSASGKTVQNVVYRSYSGETVLNYERCGLFKGSVSASAYTPYSNICPITGWDGVQVWDDPKYGGLIEWNQMCNENKFLVTGGASYTLTDHRLIIQGSVQTINVLFIPRGSGWYAVAGHKYLVTGIHKKDGVSAFFYNGTNVQTVAINSDGSAIVESAYSGDTQFYLNRGSSGNVDIDAVPQFFDLTQMFGAGNEPTTVEEFRAFFPADYYSYNAGEITTVSAVNGDTYRHYSITLPTEAGTVYGGELTVNADGSGSLVVDTITVNASDLTWVNTILSGKKVFYTYPFPAVRIKERGACLCEIYRSAIGDDGGSYTNVIQNGWTGAFKNSILVRKSTDTTDEEFANEISGRKIVYDIDSPITYTLTPTEIRTLLGENNVWADTGDLALTYTGTDEHLTLESGKKYLSRISGTDSMLLGSGQEITAVKGTDNVLDLTQMFGSAVADYVYGQGAGFFRKWFGKQWYPYNAGELLSVEGLQSHDMVGFNQWDEEWENGRINANNGLFISGNGVRSKNKIKVLPGTAYYAVRGDYADAVAITLFYYDANDNYISYDNKFGKKVSFTTPANANYLYLNIMTSSPVTAYNHDICISLSHNNSRNGEYAPYEKHSYPLDSSVVLRGIPKVGANGVYWDGDRYLPDGTVERRYGVVDLGSLDWLWNNTGIFAVNFTDTPSTSGVANILCPKYKTVTWSAMTAADRTIAIYSNGYMYAHDSNYNNAAAFKAAMQGVLLIYELATPTTETAQPYHSTQWVSDWGTEEFVSTSIVPVGTETRYPANLRDKLQHLPDAASGNGSYLITQTDGQMVLTPFPAPPSTAGNYVLKATVVNGVATYTWEVAT